MRYQYDGTEATKEQMATDVAAFLAWASEPHMEVRKKMGLMVMIYLLVLVVQFGLSFVQMYLMNWTGQKIMFDLRMEIFSHVQRLHMKYFDQNPVGRLITRMTTDVDVLNELFTAGVVSIFGDIFSPDFNANCFR